MRILNSFLLATACLLLAVVTVGCGGGDTASTGGDTATTNGDTATTGGDTATTDGDATTTNGDATTTDGDATTTNGDAATTNGGAKPVGSAPDGGEGAGDRVAELLKQLESGDDEQQKNAAVELADLGAAAAPAVDAMVRQLQDDNPLVRAHAARALGQIGDAAKPAAEALARAISDDNEMVRREALEALSIIKPGEDKVVALIIEALGNAKGAVLLAAINSLAERGADIVPAMITALEDERTVFWALLVLQEVGPDAKEAVPAVAKRLQHEHAEVQHEAAMVLRAIGPAAAPAVEALIESVKSEDDDVRVASALALGSIGPDAKDATDALKAVADSDDLTKVVSTWAVAKINPENKDQIKDQTVPVLIEQLTNSDQTVRQTAALALLDLKPAEIIGEDATVAAFSQAMEEASPEALEDMLAALAAAGPKAVPGMIKALGHPEVRRAACEVLGRVGPDAAEAVPALIAATGDDDPEVGREALLALAQIGPAAEDAVPAALKIFEDGDADDQLRVAAAFLLGKLGAGAAGAVDVLQQGMDGDNKSLVYVCAWALVQIKPDDEEVLNKAVPLLIERLQASDEAFVVGEISYTLGDVGAKAKDALPILRAKLETTSDPYLLETIEEAIQKIESE